jgi:hypothetical protein
MCRHIIGLAASDSGSWVIDTSDPLNWKAAGFFVAKLPWVAYFLLMSQQLDQIRQTNPGTVLIGLPSPVPLGVHRQSIIYPARNGLGSGRRVSISNLVDCFVASCP